ncbi:hypothetical protein CBR_g23312 [Chara braunii]|uniref:Uncharacterized protein n=1 Tax=Chara braunii TaxID=69332 RepID=A0A388L3U8_CHABU|nr:hypothetical protein CBR_g23312 [Chara braunii]|eukprot:GBG76981.1 hypothetical protein CBR_g23312 [Chara braunii]
MELNVRCLSCACELGWICVIGQCHQPQKGDGKVFNVNDMDLRNIWDNTHSSGGYNHDNEHDDDINDDVNDDDEDNSDMTLWNQETGGAHNDGDNDPSESSQNGESGDDDDDDDDDDDTGDINCWNQKTGDEERDLGGTVYWDKKRSEDKRMDFKDSDDMNGSEQEGADNSFEKARNRQGRRRDW